MIELTCVMSATSSLHIGTGKKTGTFSKTLEYVPGRTIRGMVGYYLYNNNRELFERLKINEDNDMRNTGVFFKDAYPMYKDKVTVASPVSFRWCKKCHHLMDHKITECQQAINGKRCLHEGKKETGFITKDSIGTGILEKVFLKTHIETKCPIMRSGHTSPGSDNNISPYHIESISSGTYFGFRCIVDDKSVDELKSTLCEAGIFSGLGGYRSRGYGLVTFKNIKETPVSELIEERASNLFGINNLLMVTNSPMILRDEDKSFIGFGNKFEDYISVVTELSGHNGIFKIRDDNNTLTQRITEGIARGWSIEGNTVSAIIPCIGHGSCLKINSFDPKLLAAMEVYGIGEMTNSGYGDVYFSEGQI